MASATKKEIDLSKYKYEPSESPKNLRKRKSPNSDEAESSIDIAESSSKMKNTKRPKNWPGPLPPLLEARLKLVFVGCNPGMESGRLGHYYAHPSNRFWKFLYWSHITSTQHTPFEDVEMPQKYRIGFTDLVARATRGVTQLSRQEMLEGARLLNDRIAEFEPQIVCFVGKCIWESVAKAFQWDLKAFRYGVDENHRFGHGKSVLFCVASTSGLNSISTDKQLLAWKELHDFFEAASPTSLLKSSI